MSGPYIKMILASFVIDMFFLVHHISYQGIKICALCCHGFFKPAVYIVVSYWVEAEDWLTREASFSGLC